MISKFDKAIVEGQYLMLFNDDEYVIMRLPFRGYIEGEPRVRYRELEVITPPDEDDIRRRYKAITIASLWINGQIVHSEELILHFDDNVFELCPVCGHYQIDGSWHIPLPFKFEIIEKMGSFWICLPLSINH